MGDVLMPLAIVGLILLAGSRNDRIVPFRRMNASASLHIPLILELLAVALRQGSSITRALDTVAQVVDVGLGTAVGKVTASLHKGVAWSESWALVCDDASYVGQACIVLRDTLEASWRLGASPLPRIEAVISQLNGEQRTRVESQAARLSIRLLLPTALCFLPAFVLLGVIPCISAFAQGLFA
ncbi:MAG: type II secretion system F family protein [Bifidobacterium crudilactis]|jgi:pilus assembly protein TadC|uniref:type II secretion system F family protein n=1 Tax=Bifidobacterium crudilactis TaxID=327277 RepID=UPI003A5BDE31